MSEGTAVEGQAPAEAATVEPRKGKFGKAPKAATDEAPATAAAESEKTEPAPAEPEKTEPATEAQEAGDVPTAEVVKPKRIRRTKEELEAAKGGVAAKGKAAKGGLLQKRKTLGEAMKAAHVMVANAYGVATGFTPDVEQIRIGEKVTVCVPFSALSPDYQQLGAGRLKLDKHDFTKSLFYDSFDLATLTTGRKAPEPYMQDFNEYINQ